MSKNKKKKNFVQIDVDFGGGDELALPTVCHKTEPRGRGGFRGRGRGFGRGGGRDGFDRSGFGSERKPEFDDSNFSRKAFGGKQPQSMNGGYGGGRGFGRSDSFRDRDNRGGGGFGGGDRDRDFGRSDFGSRGGGGGGGGFGRSDSFRDRDRGNRGGGSFNSFRDRDGSNRGGGGMGFGPRSDSFRESRSPNGDMGGPDASEQDGDWRGGQKKEQPQMSQISLKTSGVSPSNANPWREPRSTSSRDSGSGFGRKGFGSRSGMSSPGGNGPPRSFGGGGGSKFAGGGSASSSKFASKSSSGFGASVLKNMDTGDPRLHYGKSNRFSSLMNNDSNSSTPRSSLQKPSPSNSSRFKSFGDATQQEAFPAMKPAAKPVSKEQRKVDNMSIDELKERLRKNKLKTQAANAKKESSTSSSNSKDTSNDTATSGNGNNKQSKKGRGKKAKKPPSEEVLRKREEAKRKKQEAARKKIDQKLVSKFRGAMKDHQALEVNEHTLRQIEVGLGGKQNILRQNESNYEHIARMLVTLIFDRANTRSATPIDLAVIYDIIFNKTTLAKSQREFVALVLEILSQIEEQQSVMAVLSAVTNGDILNSFLCHLPSVETEQIATEFEEYELQYVYPLSGGTVEAVEQHLASKPSVDELVQFVSDQMAKNKIYSNYKTMALILSYSLQTFYFAECSELSDEESDDFAKALIYCADKSEQKPMARLIRMLCYHEDEGKGDDDDDDEEEEEDGDEASSHELVLLSNVLSISSQFSYRGLVSLMKAIEAEGLMKYAAIQSFVQIEDDKYTEKRLTALSKMADWIAELDARMARIQMERDNELSDDDIQDDGYVGNVFAERKHKTAADYESLSFME